MTLYDAFKHFSEEERGVFSSYIGSLYRAPDLVIAGDHEGAYLYRWVIVGGGKQPHPNVYAHLQVADDPARPLHTHPWDNMSVILAGGYIEKLNTFPHLPGQVHTYVRKPGDVIFRKASWAHRLKLPVNIKATMTLFSTGPELNGGGWGFWHNGEYFDRKKFLSMQEGASHFDGPTEEETDAGYTV